MAQVVLSAAGSAIGGPIGGAIGGTVGAMIDRAAIDSLRPAREVGPRLKTLHIMSAAEGAPIPAVFGRARVAGQVIWAARFRAARVERRQAGGKGGPRTVEEAYSLSFAVALGEGPIDGVGRIWADGKLMNTTGVIMRVHTGAEDEAPDPLIIAVEGDAPAYRGVGYVVFEDLGLGSYGNRVPQLSFEVFRRPRTEALGLEDRLTGVCLIPGAGEFVYATEPVLRRTGLTRAAAENLNNTQGRPDLLVSLDQLQAQLPNVKAVTLVVSWFGDDLRAGVCQVRPGVEVGAKDTLPFDWRAGGVDRSGARLLSRDGGRASYGGTPADRTVIQAIVELKRRGYAVTLYPFLMMDLPAGNGHPDPYGGTEQARFPWRGRITCHPAPSRPGSPDGGSQAAEQVEAFFGGARADQFSVLDEDVRFSGSEWSWSRMVLHYAKLAELAGGVDAFLIGSELRGLTWVRDAAGSHPGVAALRRLAGECRSALRPETAISYAADWSEWSGRQATGPEGKPGDSVFHLDPLWSDPAIGFVGIDWYPPAADWREGDQHLDAQAGYGGPHDPAYLLGNVAGGEGFDWFYASPADREAQVRTPIIDEGHGEAWMFRPKDIEGWWTHAHHDRISGVRSESPTGWVPKSKPIRLVEFGAPAVDKGANGPNLFYDPKSAESALPPFSNGSRDDLGQRRALEAILAYYGEPARNPRSELYGGPMVDGLSAWCWDARPFPDFPGRPEIWADAPNWTYGHWLNGRAGVAPAAALLAAVLARGGVASEELELSQATGAVTGYVIDRPMSLREALAPLLDVFGLDAAERDGRLAVVARDGAVATTLGEDDLAWPDHADAPTRRARSGEETPGEARVRFVDDAGEYQVASATVRRESPGRAGAVDVDLPVVMGRELAEGAAARRLRRLEAERETSVAHLSPEMALRMQPGDCMRLAGSPILWRAVHVEASESCRAELVRAEEGPSPTRPGAPDWRPGDLTAPAAPPVLRVLDLPPLPGGSAAGEGDGRPWVAVSGEPWRGAEVAAGVSRAALTLRTTASEPAGIGATLSVLEPGPVDRLHCAGELVLRLEGAELRSAGWRELTEGANTLAVLHPSGEWELVQFLDAALIGPDTYRIRRLLRGQAGTEPAISGLLAAGAPVVLMDEALVRAEVATAERGAALIWRASPRGASDPVYVTTESFTWRELHARPWAPAHLRGRRTPDGGVDLSWIRRARVRGDGWDGEVPLAETREVYRVEIRSGGELVRVWEVESAALSYTPDEIASDFPEGASDAVLVEVRQGSATHGWGAPAIRPLPL